jgi:hypothetical protein
MEEETKMKKECIPVFFLGLFPQSYYKTLLLKSHRAEPRSFLEAKKVGKQFILNVSHGRGKTVTMTCTECC